jgi:hypothetical protein
MSIKITAQWASLFCFWRALVSCNKGKKIVNVDKSLMQVLGVAFAA